MYKDCSTDIQNTN